MPADLLPALFFGVVGLVVGSFLNVCIDRLPQGESLVFPSSYCASCRRPLAPRDLIPVLSYLLLRGRCRFCGAPIPKRLPATEIATGVLFGYLSWHFGFGLPSALALVYVSFLIVLFFIDLEHQLILNKVAFPLMAVALIFSFFWPELGQLRSLAGGLVGLGFTGLPRLFYPQGMGQGDVKLGAAVGLMAGFPLAFVTLLFAALAGGATAATLLALRIKGRKDPIPFGPFLTTAALITLLWGEEIWQWYLRWPETLGFSA